MSEDKKRKILAKVDQWLNLDMQARMSGLPAEKIDEINDQLIGDLPPAVRAIVIERFRA